MIYLGYKSLSTVCVSIPIQGWHLSTQTCPSEVGSLQYLCKSLQIIRLVWPTRLVVLAMGEMFSFGFNLAVLDPSDEGEPTRIILLPSRITRWGFHQLLELIPLHHVILLKALLCSYELNTLDAC